MTNTNINYYEACKVALDKMIPYDIAPYSASTLKMVDYLSENKEDFKYYHFSGFASVAATALHETNPKGLEKLAHELMEQLKKQEGEGNMGR